MCENCERLQEELDHAREIIVGLVEDVLKKDEDIQALTIQKDWDELDQESRER